MAGGRAWRSIGAWVVVGAQFGCVAGAVIWSIAVRMGLYDDRRLGWVLLGVPAMVGALAMPLTLRPQWPRSRWPPAQATALTLPMAAWIAGLAGAVAGEGPDYTAPKIEASPIATALGLALGLAVVVLATVRWRSHLAVRLGAWTLGVVVMVCSVPFIVWVVGIPTFTWGRALTITSGIEPFRSLRRS